MVSEKKDFKHFYENQPFLPPQQPIKFTDLDKSHMKLRGLSPADTQLDLEVGFKLFFFTDSCWLDVAIEESD